MLAIRKSKTGQRQCVPNLLPCRIDHNGPIRVEKRYWAPTASKDGKHVSYFRGRKLHGRRLRIPQRYQGVLLASTDEKLPAETTAAASEDADEDQDEEQPKDVGIMEQSGQFNELMLWGHEVLPDDKNDPYICAIEEWLSLAEVIHAPWKPEEESEAGVKTP